MAYNTNYLTIRKAGLSDIGQIAELIVSCFGHLAIAEGALSYFLNRYYVAVADTGNIVGISGIVPENGHYAITFTCVDKHYRNQGIADALFTHILKEYNQNKPVTLCAWHLHDKDRANLDSVARKHGFVLIKPDFINRINGLSSSCKECIYSNKKDCHCCDDLYILK